MGTRQGFTTDQPMQPSCAQMNSRAPGTPQTCYFIYTSGYSLDTQQDKVDHSFSPQMSVTLMNRIAPENPQPGLFNHMDDSSMNLIPQNPAGPTTWRRYQKRTSFMRVQHEQLEIQFYYNRFPDKNRQKELALKLNLPESTIKTWFRNRRVKLRKQQQPLKQPNQIPLAKNVPASPTASTSPYFSPAASDSHSSLPHQPLGPADLAHDPVITESPVSDVQMQAPQVERLEASVPALFSDAYTIEQIMKEYSFPDEEISNWPFYSLYQYLSPTGSS